jgi:hypothetical protein
MPLTPAEFQRLAPEEQKAVREAARNFRRQRVDLARRDANVFCELVLRDEQNGELIRQAPMHMRWQELINNYNRLCIWSHVEGGKTNQVAIGRVLWELGRNPNLRVCVVSKTTDMARKIVRAIGQYISGNGAASCALREVFPHLRPNNDPALTWTAQSLTIDRPNSTAKDPSVTATGVEGNIHGSRIDLMIIDDILDLKNTNTSSPRESVWGWLRSANCMGRLTAKARVVVMGNAWHPDDAMHRLVRESGFASFRFPVIDEQGNLSWPEVWPHKRIDEARRERGPLEYARSLLCVARDDETARFKKEYVAKALAAGQGKKLCKNIAELLEDLARDGLLREEDGAPISAADVRAWDSAKRLGSSIEPETLGGVRLFTGVDLAVSKTTAADLSAFFTIAILPDGRRRVVDIRGGRWSGPEIIARVIELWGLFGSTFIVENNGTQGYIHQFLAAQSIPVPVIPFRTGAQKADPILGVEGLAVEFNSDRWIIPCGLDGTRTAETDAWLQDLYEYDPSQHTGDRLMASWFAREGNRPFEIANALGGGARATIISV